MRVALVCDDFLPQADGLAARVRDLAHALRASGVEPHVVARKGADYHDIPLHLVASPFAPGTSATLSALFRRESFDVVHAHVAGFSPLAYRAALLGARVGLASVITFQTMLDQTSALLGASDALLGWSRDIVLTASSSVVAAQAARAIPGASVGVLPPGVDAHFWRSTARHGTRADIHFVSALGPAGSEGASSLVRAFATAVQFVAGSPEMHLTIIAEGRVARSVGRLAADLGIRSRVTLAGPLSGIERRALYADADVFVLPGAREAFGISALEARAAGLPVVARLSSGARDFITPGLHGLLARDEAEMARFMSRLALEDPLRRFITNRNLIEAPPYDWPLVAQMHRTIYDAAAALREAPAPTSHA